MVTHFFLGVIALAKSKVLHFRVTDRLKELYDEALEACGISQTDHLTNEIRKFINAHEKKRNAAIRLAAAPQEEKKEATL